MLLYCLIPLALQEVNTTAFFTVTFECIIDVPQSQDLRVLTETGAIHRDREESTENMGHS